MACIGFQDDAYMAVSSAYIASWVLSNVGMSLMNIMMKSMGPSIDPWGGVDRVARGSGAFDSDVYFSVLQVASD